MDLSFWRGMERIPVLMFHGLCEQVPNYMIFKNGRTCILEVKNFSKIIEWCVRNYDILRLEDIEKNFAHPSRKRPGMILTFDDGLASVIDLALPILRKYHISAVVFVTTNWINTGCTPDIFLLEKAAGESLPVSLEIRVDGKRLELLVRSKKEASSAFLRLWEFLFSIRFPPLKLTSENILMNGRKWRREDVKEDRYFWFPASWKQLGSASQEGLIEIGSHSVDHIPLPWLSNGEKQYQLNHSREELASRIGVPVIAYSYPHGIIDEPTVLLAEKVYKWCFTNEPRRIQGNTRPGKVPRFHVPGEVPQNVITTLRWGVAIGRLWKKFI